MPAQIVPPEEVLTFWLGENPADPETASRQKPLWWGKSDALDQEVRDRFGATLEAAAAGDLDSWAETPRGRLALVIVLDQMSRNAYRDTARMYAQDERAVAHVRAALEAGEDRELAFYERVFLYMPLMHAEDLTSQELCCEKFDDLAESSEGALEERARNHFDYAVQHRDIVARFGRFPHRNAILGRDTTSEEAAFLEQPGSSF